MKRKKHYTINIGRPERANILLIGCGGTGSFLALHLARLAYHCRERHNIELDLTFIDHDYVERQNIGRQNFCFAEINKPKARTLAWRYAVAFGLSINYHIAKFHSDQLPINRRSIPTVLIGAVDNNFARNDIHQALIERKDHLTWWLDCGNNEYDGQVLIGNRPITHPEITDLGCAGLPLPTCQRPELLDLLPDMIKPTDEAESCAELAIRDAQSLMINQMVASHAANYLSRLFISRDLDMMATYFNLVYGTAWSTHITK